MGRKFHVNQTVRWSWGNGETQGKIHMVYEQRRHNPGRDKANCQHISSEPAYLIEQQNGGRVLKSESELRDAFIHIENTAAPRPLHEMIARHEGDVPETYPTGY